MRLPLTTRAATAVLAVVAVVAVTWAAMSWYAKSRPAVTVGAFGIQPAPDTGVTAIEIGGPFELVAHTGETVSDATFRGKFMLVFFGYTYCPDVCPTDLQVMSEALDLLGDKGQAVQPIFITVDPERDTTDAMADYVGAFHPRLVGLTGTKEQVAAAAKAYRAAYFKVFYPPFGDAEDDGDKEATEAETGEPDAEEVEDEDYLVNHSAFTYLMGPDGGYLTVFPHKTSAEDMAKVIAAELEKERLTTGGSRS
jgi:protein SCO1/2